MKKIIVVLFITALIIDKSNASDVKTIKIFKNPGEFVSYRLEKNVRTCGLVGENFTEIGYWDDPKSFKDKEARKKAETVFFSGVGYLEYEFNLNNKLPLNARIERIDIITELSSEYPGQSRHNMQYPSDISMSINGKKLGVWTAPGDLVSGWRVIWSVRKDGTYIKEKKVSNKKISDYRIRINRPIRVRMGVDKDARYKGGMNIYGDRTGKHGKDIMLVIYYTRGER